MSENFRNVNRIAPKKRGQAAIFVIVAIVIVGAILVYLFALRQPKTEEISPEIQQVFAYYDNCIKEQTKAAISLAGMQGGWVNPGTYIPGSEYAPFSSQLNFLGTPVKYWYYVAGNGLIKEQVPSKTDIQNGISDFVEENMAACDFREFIALGYNISYVEPEVNIMIDDTQVSVDVNSPLTVGKNGVFASKNTHSVTVESKIGKFYTIAKNIYAKQKQDAFFEKYALDVLYLYAPVDGVEIQCGPKIWSTQRIISEVREALENNFAMIKFSGNYYTLKNKDSKYFVVDQTSDEAVNVMYSRNWPTKMEVYGEGVDESTMIAEPVGTQEGLGVMGFCYVPYHFVYDLSFPAMVQIYDTNEVFQFPVVVAIDKTVPRKAQVTNTFDEGNETGNLCAYKQQEIQVDIYDVNLQKVDANLSYECFNQRCLLGQSRSGTYRGFAPVCVNGYLIASAGGYAEKKQLMSTNKEVNADVLLEREYEVQVEMEISGRALRGSAIVTFTREDGKTRAVSLPGEDKVKLSEGSYEVKAYAFGNSSVVIPASTKLECVDVPKSGLLGLFGGTEEKCFDITTPESKIDSALIGGGSLNTYILESQLQRKKLTIKTQELPMPNSIEQLQKNFESFETRRLELAFNER